MYQMLGAKGGKCGSFASSGLPEAVSLPETTQLLLACVSSAEAGLSEKASGAVAGARPSAICASVASSASSGDSAAGDELPCDWCAGSAPTTKTSSGEVSGNSSSRFAFGKPASEARIMSYCHVFD